MNHILNVGLLLLVTLVVRAQFSAPGHTKEISAILQAKPCHQQHTTMGGVGLDLKGIYIDSGLLWLVFRGVNHSAIDFRPATMHITIRDKHALKRRALQERMLTPVIRYEPSVLAADSTVLFCYGLVPRIPGRKQELEIEWMERNGDRRLQLQVSAAAILTARRLIPGVHKN
ncbi:MAG TPA: DUF4138 domain-containing protein [Puia sp.]|nr:DUF4138 domain-containing protein [Puia sp.]